MSTTLAPKIGLNIINGIVIANEVKQSSAMVIRLDCFTSFAMTINFMPLEAKFGYPAPTAAASGRPCFACYDGQQLCENYTHAAERTTFLTENNLISNFFIF
jgi:hypothetical protein